MNEKETIMYNFGRERARKDAVDGRPELGYLWDPFDPENAAWHDGYKTERDRLRRIAAEAEAASTIKH